MPKMDFGNSALVSERLKDFRAGLFRRCEIRSTMLATFPIDDTHLIAARAGFPGWPFLHRQKCQETRKTEQQMKNPPAYLSF